MNTKSRLAFVAFIVIYSQLGISARQSHQLKKGPKEISRIIRENMSKLNSCYIEKANTSYDPGGKVTIAITTSGSGHVSGIKLVKYSLKPLGKKEFLQCVANELRSWKFPVTGAYSRTFVQSFYFG